MIVRCLACGKAMIADDKHPGFQVCGCENNTMVGWCDEYLYRLGGVDLSKVEVDGKTALPKKRARKPKKLASGWRRVVLSDRQIRFILKVMNLYFETSDRRERGMVEAITKQFNKEDDKR